mmetsp:Transcript_73045/g.225875  ORF Transcript_73045/g.225875 Transcript_73045/m.225875 type:complete len:499 (+) Transcript_73045:51-1547(+)
MRLLITIIALLAATLDVAAYERHRNDAALAPDLREEFSEAALSLSSSLAAPADDRHPFWVFEWELASNASVLECALVLVLAGLLCSAGGIGGGGIYVSVLMVVGRLSPRDAVPLSKAVVFSGAISSLVLNLGRTLSGKSGQDRPVIDYTICRLVVPAALLGTLFGVLINRNAGDAAIVLVLSAILLGMTAMVLWTTYSQYIEEEKEAALALIQRVNSGQAPDVELSQAERPPDAVRSAAETALESSGGGPGARPASRKSQLVTSDKYLSVGMLFIVVASGVVRHHARACVWELQHGSERSVREAACRHPTLRLFVGNQLESWMADPSGPSLAMLLTLAVPLTVCLGVMSYISHDCVKNEGWGPLEVAKYQLMGVLTGGLAGLIGIGGGLVFSPFFLIMGVEPAVAVATSSTCVIFTSSSTTMQYLFTDRIIMSLTVIYGIANSIASYGGTAFVHFVTDRFATRRSYITGIVALGVLLSAILSLTKLVSNSAAGGTVHF